MKNRLTTMQAMKMMMWNYPQGLLFV